MRPSVDVHLVTWNGAHVLSECLRSLSEQSTHDWNLKILDNGSTDGSQDLLQEWTLEHGGHLETRAKNLGFAAAHNELLRRSEADYVLVLNQDVILASTYIEKLVDYIVIHRDVGSVTGLLFRAEVTATGIDQKKIVDSAGLVCRRTHRVIERARETTGATLTTTMVFGVPATAALYRKAALEAAHMSFGDGQEFFDQSYGSYKEDVDLAYRLRLLNWQSACVVEAEGWHVRTLRGGYDAQTSFGNLESVAHRKEKDPRLNEQSYANHLMMLKSNMLFPCTSSVWWLTSVYELGKFFVILLTEPKTLHALQKVRINRVRIVDKRRELVERGADWHRIRAAME